jgi:hypothetical protein
MKTLNTINELIEKAESENERRILDTVKNTLIGEVKEASKEMSACSWWTGATYDDDECSNDNNKEVVISVDKAVDIVESIITVAKIYGEEGYQDKEISLNCSQIVSVEKYL